MNQGKKVVTTKRASIFSCVTSTQPQCITVSPANQCLLASLIFPLPQINTETVSDYSVDVPARWRIVIVYLIQRNVNLLSRGGHSFTHTHSECSAHNSGADPRVVR